MYHDHDPRLLLLSPTQAKSEEDSKGAAPSLLYDLIGVASHMGTLSKGHYTAHVNEGGRWFFCDDTWIEAVSDQEVSL